MQPITIRHAKKDDVALIANLGWQTFFDTYAQYNTSEDMESFLNKNFSKEIIDSEIKDDNNTFLLAYIKREVAGYAKLSENSKLKDFDLANCIEISRLYSVKNKIGSGVGKELMNYTIELAKAKNKKVIWLCVWSQNQRAIQFYRKFGFEKFGDYTFMLGNDAQDDWLMKLEL